MNLLGLVSILGIPFGLLLKKIAKEEIKPGKKYFVWMIKICLIIISIILTYYFKVHWLVLVGVVLAYIIPFNYLFLGLTYTVLDNFLLFILIFIFGLPYSTTLKDNKRVLLEVVLYCIPILLFINNLNVTFSREIASLTAGYIFTRSLIWK